MIRSTHDDVIKWKHFPRNWPFVRGIHRSRWIPHIPTQRPVTRIFDVFFDLRLNKRLSKQPWGWWFETLSWSLWRHCNIQLKFRLFNVKRFTCWLDGEISFYFLHWSTLEYRYWVIEISSPQGPYSKWRRYGSVHEQPWYWPSTPGIIRPWYVILWTKLYL